LLGPENVSLRTVIAKVVSLAAIKLTLAALISFSASASTTQAGERVMIETPPIQPSAFKVKRAQAQGKTLEPTPGITLSAILSVPEGGGSHPAVVIIPESVVARRSYTEWTDFLNENGFVTLLIESLSSRGKTIYIDYEPMNLLIDTQSGLDYLSGLESVDPDRIGLLSFGGSAWFVLRALDGKQKSSSGGHSYYAGVAFYPRCDPKKVLATPVLILGGARDNLMSLASCRAMADLNQSGAATIQLQIYPDATHYFDNTAYSKDSEHRGEDWVEPVSFPDHDYNAEARADAEQVVLGFLNSISVNN